jgi:hypothetical protein
VEDEQEKELQKLLKSRLLLIDKIASCQDKMKVIDSQIIEMLELLEIKEVKNKKGIGVGLRKPVTISYNTDGFRDRLPPKVFNDIVMRTVTESIDKDKLNAAIEKGSIQADLLADPELVIMKESKVHLAKIAPKKPKK